MKHRKCIRLSVLAFMASLCFAAIILSSAGRAEYAQKTPGRYQTNEKGQTYGSNADVTEPDGTPPDLTQVLGINGKVGYVYSDELNWWNPQSLEEVLEYMESEKQSCLIPVYEADGETVIDMFTVYRLAS